MLDLDAPILPGRGAAGIHLGDRLEDVLRASAGLFTEARVGNACLCDPWSTSVFRSASVDLSHRDGRVSQITVHNGYRGRLHGAVGLGSTPAEIARAIGPWEEVDADVYGIACLPGLAFGVAGWFVTAAHPGLRTAPIREIAVFAPDELGEPGGSSESGESGARDGAP
ncbi:MAG TPA: hypothetical protein VLJ14_17650 [Ktedonobacterales bacterium]|nr:hypothetical protein [Ktedonobacterales bacterium]